VSHSTCLWYALDRWHEDGGYLLLGKSQHWCIPHVLHLSRDQALTHFVPMSDLPQPWYSLLGFDGRVLVGDTSERGPMSQRGMFFGSLILMIFGAAWSVHRAVSRILRPIP